MPGLGGIPPMLNLPLTQALATAQLQAGQELIGLVQSEGGRLVLTAGNAKIPLPIDQGLSLGQVVLVHVQAGPDGGLVLRLTPQPARSALSAAAPAFPRPAADQTRAGIAPSDTPNASAAPARAMFEAHLRAPDSTSRPMLPGGASSLAPEGAALGQAIRAAAMALGVADRLGSLAAAIPAAMPPNAEVIRQAVALFYGSGSFSSDLQLLSAALGQVAPTGAPLQGLADAFAQIFGRLLGMDKGAWREALEQAARNTRQTPEARLANTGRPPEPGTLDARTLLLRIRDDAELTRVLDRLGTRQEFTNAVDRVAERLVGSQAQNLRSLEIPYLYFEAPFAPGAPINDARIHIFGYGKGKRTIHRDNAGLILDVSTSRLGAVWASLSVNAGHCQCLIMAAEDETVALARQEKDALEMGLADAGFPGATVTIRHWSGDRLRATIDILRSFSGIDLQA